MIVTSVQISLLSLSILMCDVLREMIMFASLTCLYLHMINVYSSWKNAVHDTVNII